MMASHAGIIDKRTFENPTGSIKSGASKQKRKPSASQEARVKYMHAIREKYQLRGFSNTAIELLLKSWRKSTLNQYLVYAKLWFRFSSQGLTPTVRNIIEFLVHLHSKGFNQKQIRQARSAVAILSDVDQIGKHPDIKRIIKGMFEDKPQYPIYTSVWNVNTLFNYLRSIPHQRDLSLEMLSKKVAILICLLAGGQRSQTVHTIKATDILVNADKCIIPIYDTIKQSKEGKHMKPLEFKVYTEDKLCVVQNLTCYLEKTRQIRTASALFLSYQKPYHPVSKDTVRRWVNDMMNKSGIDMNKYVTHSCRAAASSYAHKRKIPLKKIMDSCGWTSESTFANHYRKKIEDDLTIGEQMLL